MFSITITHDYTNYSNLYLIIEEQLPNYAIRITTKQRRNLTICKNDNAWKTPLVDNPRKHK